MFRDWCRSWGCLTGCYARSGCNALRTHALHRSGMWTVRRQRVHACGVWDTSQVRCMLWEGRACSGVHCP